MNKTDLVKNISSKTSTPEKEVQSIINLLFLEIRSSVFRDEKVVIQKFGTFKAKNLKARKLNSFGKEILIPERKAVKFYASDILNEGLNT